MATKVLPEDICKLTSLTDLTVEDNPLVKPPQEVCEGGLPAIRAYFSAGPRVKTHRLKLMLVGQGEVRPWVTFTELARAGADSMQCGMLLARLTQWLIPGWQDLVAPAAQAWRWRCQASQSGTALHSLNP